VIIGWGKNKRGDMKKKKYLKTNGIIECRKSDGWGCQLRGTFLVVDEGKCDATGGIVYWVKGKGKNIYMINMGWPNQSKVEVVNK